MFKMAEKPILSFGFGWMKVWSKVCWGMAKEVRIFSALLTYVHAEQY